MNTNEKTIIEMIVQRLENGQTVKGLINLLHEQTAQTLPRAVQLGSIDSADREQIIEECKTILKNGEFQKWNIK